MIKDEALKMALETLEYAGPSWIDARQPAITAIKEALAQDALDRKAENARELGLNYEPEQKPVAWMCADESLINKGYARFSHVCMGDWKIPVYTTKPQPTWVGLTADEMETLYQQATYMDDTDHIHMLMMAEAKLKEKNHD